MSTRANRIGLSHLPLLAALLVVGCSRPANGPGSLRFYNSPVVWQDGDRKPIPRPEGSRHLPGFYSFNQLVHRPVDRYLAVPRRHRATNVNALGEVPSSTWFENRVGRRSISPEAVRRGPKGLGGPDRSGPLVITSSKEGGKQIGFIVKDARGDRFLIKFDRAGVPVAETAAHIVAHRLLWLVGYHVAEDTIIDVRTEDFRVADDATMPGFAGRKVPFTASRLAEIWKRVTVGKDGRIRVLASRFLPGKPLGGFAQSGVRDDDANDRVPHERRRELRGMYVFYSWLKSTDIKTDNTLDMWNESADGRGVVHHYLLDFGMSLGTNALALGTRGDGYEQFFNYGQALSRIPTLGLRPWHWEQFDKPAAPHVGVLEVEGYRPEAFVSRMPYFPWQSRDRFDAFWAAKILARVRKEHIDAAVAAAAYAVPASAKYVSQALWGRRRIALRHWFSNVAPIDAAAVVGDELCFDDLGAAEGVLAAPIYRVSTFDYEGRKLQSGRPVARNGAHYCTGSLALGTREASYTIVRLRGTRHGKPVPAVDVHLARVPGNPTLQVVGVRRH